MNVNHHRAWYYVRDAHSMPGDAPPIVDLLASGWTGALVSIDDPFLFPVAEDCFKLGTEFGVWAPDQTGESAGAYVQRVSGIVSVLDAEKLNPHLVVLNPEHNGKGAPDDGTGKPTAGWTWFGKMCELWRTARPTRVTEVSVPGLDAFYNLPAATSRGINVRLQCYGGNSSEIFFDPRQVVDFAVHNGFVSYSVDPRRISLDVSPRWADAYLESAVYPEYPQGLPRLAAAGARGVALFPVDDAITDRSYRKFSPVLPYCSWRQAA